MLSLPVPSLLKIGQAIAEVNTTNQELLRKYRRELQLRKKCHNELVRLKGLSLFTCFLFRAKSESVKLDPRSVDSGVPSLRELGGQEHFSFLAHIFGWGRFAAGSLAHKDLDLEMECHLVLTEKKKKALSSHRIQENSSYKPLRFSSKGNIRVFGRVRPISKEDGEGQEAACAVTFDPDDDAILHLMHKSKLVSFELDKVFTPEATQEDVSISHSSRLVTAVG